MGGELYQGFEVDADMENFLRDHIPDGREEYEVPSADFTGNRIGVGENDYFESIIRAEAEALSMAGNMRFVG